MISIDQHNIEIQNNRLAWKNKPLLRLVYAGFYIEIVKQLNINVLGEVLEIGSGIGNFKSVYPSAIATDIFPNPWIDRVESAYNLSFQNLSISNIILFDVFHHLAHPGSALDEFKRVLVQSGRVIIFEPYISLLGFLAYGIFHHEPIGIFKKINWKNIQGSTLYEKYYAAQGNATRIFGRFSNFESEIIQDWNITFVRKYSALSYILSGGFSHPTLYPKKFLPALIKIERFLDFFPIIFATRVMIVLEKK